MKRTMLCLGLLGAVWLSAADAFADGSVTITGEIRARSEVDKKSFDDSAHTKTFSLLRTRVGVRGQVNENVHAFVQFQDSRMLGADDRSGTLTNGENVDVHQAFLHIAELWSNGPGLKAGRFELNLGNQRVFGAVGWNNVGRSWEGIQAFLRRASFGGDIFWLKRRELNNSRENRDFDIIGTALSVPRIGTDILVAYEHDGSSGMKRASIGGFLQHRVNQVEIISNGVFQTGTEYPVSTDKRDISAFLLTGEVIVHLDSPGKPNLSAGFDFASGDDDPADNETNTYNNLYYTGHKFRGHMDYFVASNREGLLDLLARASIAPVPGWRLGLDAHYFRSAAEYQGTTGEMTNSIGAEFDLHASTTRIAGAKIASGVSVFLPSEEFAGPENEPGLWGYLMITVGFGSDK
ncbi:MAG: hypothetical protein Kow0074_02590 [Candidatus Zixiibacteriota bacterium]